MNPTTKRFGILILALLGACQLCARATVVSTSYGISRQVNISAQGQNIPGDAANEPSMCVDPTNPNRMAIGWRQFDTTNSDFRQAGVGYTTNGGLTWTFPGDQEPGVFHSDPVLASDANGIFYYLGIDNENTFSCDLMRSTNGGASWQVVGSALGGDKEWMAIDATSGFGRGNIYQTWSPFYNVYNDNIHQIFTRSTDSGNTWMTAIDLPHEPLWGTIDIGPNGEVYMIGTGYDIVPFRINRSSDATNGLVTPTIDVSTSVDLGGPPVLGIPGVNPDGLLGQAWVAVDRSTGPTRGNVYALCSVTNDPGNLVNVMFSRSTNGGQTWSTPLRINDDSPNQYAAHWFGTLSVAPNGRVDACWNDTRHSTNNTQSELYYSWSDDGGLTWAANRPLSPQFDHSLGYPQQDKIGDYMQMVSLNEGACIAYSATFNGEQDIYFVRAELPINASIRNSGNSVQITWNSTPGVNYCVQSTADVTLPWGTNIACLTATATITSVSDTSFAGNRRTYYRIVREP
jgi:hypothetical protein